MLKAIAAVVFVLAGTAAQARCVGPNLIETLSPADNAELAEAVAEHPYPEGNLWRAEKSGATVYVVGTVHIPDPRLDPIFATAAPWVDMADILILEATSDMQAEMQRRMAEQPEIAFLTEGPTLIDLLGNDLWAQLSEDLRARGIPPFMAAKFRPWLLAMTLAIPACATEALLDGEMGLDARLETRARTGGVPIAALDDLDSLIDLLGGGDIDEQIEMLRLFLMTDLDQSAIFATTLDSYFTGRHRELWEFNRLMSAETGPDQADQTFATMEERLLLGRNRDWADELPALVGGRDAVLAIGAAHLSGETGVLRTLERLGYRLTQVSD